MTQLRAALFDMDGVLIDSLHQHRESWIQYCAGFNITISQEKFDKEYFGHQGPEIIRRVFGEQYPLEERKKMSAAIDVLFQSSVRQKVIPVAGVKEFIVHLKLTGIPMALGTSGSAANVASILGALHLNGEFSQIITEEDVTRSKPDPSVYLFAAKRLGVAINECVVFEDTPVGISAAKSAGAFCIALTTTTDKSRLSLADAIIPDFQLLRWSDVISLLKSK